MKAAVILASAAAAATLYAAPARALQQPPAPAPSAFTAATEGTIAAAPADVATIDAIMRAVYDVISGPAGQKRDWDRMRSLFTANARLMPHGPKGLRSGSVEDYIATSGPMLEKDGFVEREIGRKVDRYGDIAQVFSAYEARRSESGPVILRGINSFQLVRHGGRWWVVSILWQAETPDNPIPASYLSFPPTGERG